jgi:hypothetical protein
MTIINKYVADFIVFSPEHPTGVRTAQFCSDFGWDPGGPSQAWVNYNGERTRLFWEGWLSETCDDDRVPLDIPTALLRQPTTEFVRVSGGCHPFNTLAEKFSRFYIYKWAALMILPAEPQSCIAISNVTPSDEEIYERAELEIGSNDVQVITDTDGHRYFFIRASSPGDEEAKKNQVKDLIWAKLAFS